MSRHPAARAGFARPRDYRGPRCHRRAVLAQLITISSLLVSIAVTATAVSIGMARTHGLPTIHDYGATFAAAGIVAVLVTGVGGLTAIAAHQRWSARAGAKRPR